MESTEVQYRHNKMMGEISGFGGGYEECCQDMLEAGVKWLTAHNNAKLSGHTFKGVYGVFVPDSDDAKELERVIFDAADGKATGAMLYAVMGRLFYIASNGWEAYVAKLSSDAESAGRCRMALATHIIKIAKSERCHIQPDGTILFPDALGRTALALALEDEFGIPDLPKDEVERCCSVSDWVALVGRASG